MSLKGSNTSFPKAPLCTQLGHISRHRPLLKIKTKRTVCAASTTIAALQVRRATAADYWPIADMHCQAFYPHSNGFWAPLLRLDRVLSLHVGSERQSPGTGKFLCLIASEDGDTETADVYRGSLGFFLDSIVSLTFPQAMQKNYCASHEQTGLQGAIVIDTLADHLPPRRVEINGVIREFPRQGVAYISNLAVSPAIQRRGIGLKLLKTAEVVAQEWKCRSVALHVDPTNVKAVELYKKNGYKAVSKQPEWQRIIEGRSNALTLMMKRLPKQ